MIAIKVIKTKFVRMNATPRLRPTFVLPMKPPCASQSARQTHVDNLRAHLNHDAEAMRLGLSFITPASVMYDIRPASLILMTLIWPVSSADLGKRRKSHFPISAFSSMFSLGCCRSVNFNCANAAFSEHLCGTIVAFSSRDGLLSQSVTIIFIFSYHANVGGVDHP